MHHRLSYTTLQPPVCLDFCDSSLIACSVSMRHLSLFEAAHMLQGCVCDLCTQGITAATMALAAAERCPDAQHCERERATAAGEHAGVGVCFPLAGLQDRWGPAVCQCWQFHFLSVGCGPIVHMGLSQIIYNAKGTLSGSS